MGWRGNGTGSFNSFDVVNRHFFVYLCKSLGIAIHSLETNFSGDVWGTSNQLKSWGSFSKLNHVFSPVHFLSSKPICMTCATKIEKYEEYSSKITCLKLQKLLYLCTVYASICFCIFFYWRTLSLNYT